MKYGNAGLKRLKSNERQHDAPRSTVTRALKSSRAITSGMMHHEVRQHGPKTKEWRSVRIFIVYSVRTQSAKTSGRMSCGRA